MNNSEKQGQWVDKARHNAVKPCREEEEGK